MDSPVSDELVAHGRAIVDANLYMVLGTADADGRPWATPVYYAPSGYRDFFWVSEPGARHSRNVAARGDVSIVIFDSTVPINSGQAVYMSATARELTGAERAEVLELYSRRTLEHGGREWTVADVEAPAALRLYQATAAEQWVLDEHDDRVPVALAAPA
jgi:nitroimidazol reductase NimA-like FMN-containing flavoprotein (pyridoxamine 5'-phosphate oxidase superfamily)